MLKELMGDKEWGEAELSQVTGKPVYAVRSVLRGMIRRKEVKAIKPKVLPAPFTYRLRGSK